MSNLLLHSPYLLNHLLINYLNKYIMQGAVSYDDTAKNKTYMPLSPWKFKCHEEDEGD